MFSEDKLEKELNNQQLKRVEKSASEDVKEFYNKNKDYIQSCYNYYLQYEYKKEDYVKSPQYDVETFKMNLKGNIILVLTANPIEEGILLHSLSDIGKAKLDFYIINDYVYHVCQINEYTIVHMHASRTGEESTRKILNAASCILEPNTIVLLGICYGLDFTKYKLGNVLIASNLKIYRLNFRDSDEGDETIFEAEEENPDAPPSPIKHLIDKIRNEFSYRNIYSMIPEMNGSKRTIQWISGTILSSNSLMSSKRVKEAVIKAFGSVKPKPLGGEMEGGGLQKSKFLEEQVLERWLIVKSICDWGEKKNLLDEDPNVSELIKDSIQAMAMVHSWSVFYEMLMQKCFE